MSVSELVPGQPGRAEFERTPPQDLGAEQSVLGGMLLSKDAVADVVEVLKSSDFYRPAHQIVFDTILDLYGKGEPADPVTVSAELSRAGQLVRVGGAPYLHTLISSVPTAANAGYYAKIVADRAVMRRLVEAGTRIVQLGYGADAMDAEAAVDLAEAQVYEVAERRTAEDYVLLEQCLQGTLDEIESIGNRGGVMSGVPTGFADLDALMHGLHPGQLIVVAARPAIGKSTLGLDLARTASIKHQLPSVIFSLEMSRSEITMRLLSAEARVPLHHMRGGTMTDEDWSKLARRMGEVAEAPLYIDDSPNLTMMEIRSKARRLRQRHDLRLVVVDYMQLMTSNRKVESRQQEVSEMSRAMKLLAKELEVPVVAISQLNRGPEQRTDKKPQLSDLRESGCLTSETRVLRADTGAEVSLGELYDAGARDVPVWALDERLRYVRRHLTHVFTTGVRPVHRLRLASGREVRATANHPFLTYEGWTPLAELAIGQRVAAARHVPAPEQVVAWDDREVVLLAHMTGGGSFVRRRPISYTGTDEANLAAVTEAARHLGVTAVRDDDREARGTTLRLPAPYGLPPGAGHPVAEWLDGLGLLGARSHEKAVPEPVFALPKRQVSLFLRHLWATDGGCVHTRRAGVDGPPGMIHYTTTSGRLADDVARLLWRYGIQARIEVITAPGCRPGHRVHVSGAADQRAFLDVIGVHGARGESASRLLQVLDGVNAGTDVDTVPRQVWDRVRDLLVEQCASHRRFPAAVGTRLGGSALRQPAPSRARLARIAHVLDDSGVEMLATNDVAWDTVVAVDPDGEEPVFDATVAGAHNFVANGVAVHNSIEQDADVVILLSREDAYERESPRAGEADFIVAKHRNGPTATVTVAFQGHYSRFVDMSPA